MKHPLRIFAAEVGTPDMPQLPGAHTNLHAAMLAHEIRNPLASLELFVSLLEKEPTRETLEQLRAGVRRISGTVENVLALHDGRALRMEPIALGPAIAGIVEFARPVVEQSGLQLHFQGAELGNRAMASQAGLQQILFNLLLNAVRFTKAPGEILVHLERASPTHCRFSVIDSGVGIAPEDVSSIFRPGWSGRGTSPGLGLAVSQRIAAAHGTALQVHSTPGCGATFSMELALL